MRSILVLDDDPGLGRMLALVLRSGGYTVETCIDGLAALDAVSERTPDLIVLDLMMPDMDGETFYNKVHALGYAGPVIVVSASLNGRKIAGRIGADAFMPKPFDPEDLLANVDDILGAVPTVGIS